MDLKLKQNEFDGELTECGEVMFISKASGVEQITFNNIVQIIDEKGNEVNCTIDKFIEIFDAHGFDGFL